MNYTTGSRNGPFVDDLSHANNNSGSGHSSTNASALTPTASNTGLSEAPQRSCGSAPGVMSASEIDSVWMDKLLRAVFVRLFAQLFAGYRYCLLVIRISPRPVIGFNKPAFLREHGLAAGESSELVARLLDSMSFQRFIEERGPAYRTCDVFDEVYASVQSQLRAECDQHASESSGSHASSSFSASLVMTHLRQIAEKLFAYEYPHTSVSRAASSAHRQPGIANGHQTINKSKYVNSSQFILFISFHNIKKSYPT
jgi:hypothetical protein